MIIRRRRNSGYTIIGNDVFEDARLSYEAAGLLGYLLSRPDHWEVRPTQLAERRGIGRDRLRRMLGELIDAGYLRREKQRDEKTGAFTGDTYLVFDEPQKADPEEVCPAPENPSLASDGLASAGKPVAGLYKESASTEDSGITEEREGAREEGQEAEIAAMQPLFGSAWPTYALDNPDLATRALRALTADERKAALAAIPAYLDFHRAQKGKQPLPHLHNYLNHKRWLWLPERSPAAAREADISRLRSLTLTVFTRPWWWLLCERAERDPDGAKRMLAVSATTGTTMLRDASELPSEAELARMVELDPKSPAWKAWGDYLARRIGARPPTPDKVPRVWAPAPWPPDARQAEAFDANPFHEEIEL